MIRNVRINARSRYPITRPALGIPAGKSSGRKDFKNNMHWCSVGNNLVVDSTGNTYPCVLLMDPRFRLGNIRDNKFSDFSSAVVLNSLQTALESRTSGISKCIRCIWKNFCQAGCMGMAYETYGTVWMDDGFCLSRRRRYMDAVMKLAGHTVKHSSRKVHKVP